ncbi:MAG: molybdopterin-binding oxidoreductase [Chloroflexi bacterium]|nr:MAG: molybdopterin-binding oxidoreductase [Chloroflexota bacterium]
MGKLNRPNTTTGILIGLLLTTPLIAIFAAGDELFGLPVIPFDLFDWAAQLLPGALVTFGIDLIVDIIHTFDLGQTDTAAKIGEQVLAYGVFLLLGVLSSVIFFAFMNRHYIDDRDTPGIIMGLLIGIPLLLISFARNQTATADPVIGAAWTILVFIGWGIAHSRIFDELTYLDPEPAAADDDTPATEQSETSEPVPAKPRTAVELVDRRQFLVRVGGAAATITVVGAGLSRMMAVNSAGNDFSAEELESRGLTLWSAENPLPNADDPLIPAPGTRPEFTPLEQHYRIDINLSPPVINEADWTLRISGLVENPMELTLDELRNNYEPIHEFITMACISNPIGGDLIGTQRWTGLRMQDLLADVQPMATGTHLRITSVDGFDEILARSTIERDERVMLCYAWDGVPLSNAHGFPLRVYVPGVFGMKQPKWITEIEFVDDWEEGYWVRRGWDPIATMLTTSVIDTVAVQDTFEQDGQTFVPVGGMAHASTRGIGRVEIRIDDGEWQQAEVRSPMSDASWVLWRFDWPFSEGRHVFRVRAVEANGTPQIETVRDTRPSGATGLHARRFRF